MKLLYLIAGTYRPAGMERVLAQKANWLAAHGYEVVIATTDQRGQKPAFHLDPSIRTVDLGINYEENNGGSFADKMIHYPKKHRLHRQRLGQLLTQEHPNITISMFNNDADILPSIKDGSRKVLEVHFSRYKKIQYGRKGLWAIADRYRTKQDLKVAGRYDKFIVLTHEDKQYWKGLSNIEVISNGRTFTFDAPAELDNHQILAVGRYEYQKGFDRLLEAWRQLGSATEGWTLRIAGSGEDLGPVPANVVLGPADDIKQEYLNSSILVSTSRYEGLPMVMLEAQAAGLPIVAYACKCGPKDIIFDGVDGYLVEDGDIESLKVRLQELMTNSGLRKQMGAAAYKASDRFDSEAIMQRWNKLFTDLCAR